MLACTSWLILNVGMTNGENQFILKPSEIPGAGVGCFAMSAITEGSRLNNTGAANGIRYLEESAIPDVYLKYCPLMENGLYLAPANFTMMSVYWYINHAKQPNAVLDGTRFFALRNLMPEEEVTIYYPDLLTHPKNLLWVRPEDI